MNKVRVGLIGSQFVSGIHAESLKYVPDAEIFAVASPTEEHVRTFAQEHDIPNYFTDYKKMLDEAELDMVFICVPPSAHADMEVLVAERGLHMLVEKPVNLYLDDAIRAHEAIKKAGVVTSVGYLAGYSNMDRALRKFVADKTIE